jgi:segregation and condensation protein B
VLAIVAYNQPVTRAFIEQIRGVDSTGVVTSLIEKELLEEAGRLELPGRPIAYRTSDNFLRCFGLENLDQLPSIDPEEEQSEPEALEEDGQLDFSMI